jgi:hypothetical protein
MIPHDKFLARLIAALFVLTTLMGMIDAYVAAPILQGPLADIHENSAAVLTGALMRLFMAIGVIGIALAFLPVIRRYNETIAMSYLAFRTAECVLLCLGVCGHVFLVGLSRNYTGAGGPDDAVFLALAQGATGFSRSTYQMAMTILGIGSMMLCLVLLRAQLIPAWIARLGIIGYALLLTSAILDLLGVIDTLNGGGAVMYIPGGLFELIILPVWLWIRGFNTVAPTRQTPAKL